MQPDQPTSHGFDEHCLWVQYWDGKRPSRYYGPHNWENGEYRAHSKEVYGPDFYCDFLLDFIERNRELPFFAYFPMNLIHGPLIEPPALQELAASSFPDDLGAKTSTHFWSNNTQLMLRQCQPLGEGIPQVMRCLSTGIKEHLITIPVH